ncbi:LysR family transcriptional regulator [Streptomyces sp. S3(2020)]|uniref:LysR family transcriptional regulator n=1 Tax=Streptomyces sp. S3(2020) TaxID=2732044 RepID=UPI0014888453|nr:LysR family transcriptional regulator [Streptomyces sp. S3(2020)]NNN29136.1 LysR family transcriptional regulator [Streptomyces sp. S3(2020)]
MQLRQLEYFVAICEAGSFSAAAVRLYVAQPSLSQQIRALEKELGAELLERGRHGVTLTPAGRILLPQAQRAIQAIQEAHDSVRQVVEGRIGDVHVLTVRSVASGILPSSAARWHALFPSTVLRLHDFSHRRALEDAVRSGQGDIAVGPRPSSWEGPVVSLGYEEMVVIGPAGHGAGTIAEPAELADADWVLYEAEQGMSEVVDWVTGHLGFTPRAVARTGQVSAALLFAVEGLGMTVAPENAVPLGWARHARRIGPGFYRELVAYSRKHPSQLAQRYRDMLTSVELPLIAEGDLPEGTVHC